MAHCMKRLLFGQYRSAVTSHILLSYFVQRENDSCYFKLIYKAHSHTQKQASMHYNNRSK